MAVGRCAETSLYFLRFTVSRSLSKLLACAILAMVTPLFVESAGVFRKGLFPSRVTPPLSLQNSELNCKKSSNAIVLLEEYYSCWEMGNERNKAVVLIACWLVVRFQF